MFRQSANGVNKIDFIFMKKQSYLVTQDIVSYIVDTVSPYILKLVIKYSERSILYQKYRIKAI